ncbi:MULTISPECIES: helix-turn-helix domain-containing protein [Actinotignum]|uniref:helix-turn-helix domain-containing protein n=1 Tax=Actinotignum TaxID=1653174 RepID=UPI0025516F15|nr:MULTISPECIES: helix-turn-helix domain-containing protein [Actinotignum]MDE1535970.1 helix-turn-helix domain-containing protein [Actinotignum schaalii]MDK7271737.1 helix-turn-helix domain-containing protein [Actinotignum schaalii]MDY5130208.1 helix-turn-helix domain-containing protein [Actinotignum timonense]MDY5144341.1 helix-turn-helix domain-containing protein [Actinotignum timonense]
MTITHDDKIAQIDPEIMDRIRRLLAKSRRVGLTFDGVTIEIPPLLRAQISMAVQEEPDGDREISTQEAADLLNMTRPTVVKLCEEGALPFRKITTHRRLWLSDVLNYREKQRQVAKKALDEISDMTYELGLYDQTPEEIEAAIAEIRRIRKGL